MSSASTSAPNDPLGSGEFRGSLKTGVSAVFGATFEYKRVTFYDIAGMAIIEGDIAIGSVEAATAMAEEAAELAGTQTAEPEVVWGVAITGRRFRWPQGQIPYTIDPALPNQQRVSDAIAHWEAQTALRFVLRTVANALECPNWVEFTDAGGCWSYVGMQGGMQIVSLDQDCSTGTVIHEIGHAVGLWHEQSRTDRDRFVTIQWQNIHAGMEAQFNQFIAEDQDLGPPYDYASVMHWPSDAFSGNGLPTIEPHGKVTGSLGQRTGLSDLDVARVDALYGRDTPESRPVNAPYTEARAVDDGFWLERGREMVSQAISRQEAAAESLKAAVAWFWTVYSGAALVGVAVSERNLPIGTAVLLALPSLLLVLAYALATYVVMPQYVQVDMHDASQIREQQQLSFARKRRLLAIALAAMVAAGIGVAGAVVATALA